VAQLFGDAANCRLEAIGAHYVEALLQARILITYGGYNSLMDALHARLPTLVVLREMSDAEQESHLARLTRATGKLFATVPEAAPGADQLAAILLERLQCGGQLTAPSIDTAGAAAAAGYLHDLLQASSAAERQ
jgi:predicted glycosyltransferase